MLFTSSNQCIRLRLEIINADAIQLYNGMSVERIFFFRNVKTELPIATARLSVDQQENIPHHLYGTTDPSEIVDVTKYKALATDLISSLSGLPTSAGYVVVGGTNYYLESLIFQQQSRSADAEISSMKSLSRLSHPELLSQDTAKLYETLTAKAPDVASYLHPHDRRKILRALDMLDQADEAITGADHASGSIDDDNRTELVKDCCSTPQTPVLVDEGIHVIVLETNDMHRLEERIRQRYCSNQFLYRCDAIVLGCIECTRCSKKV